MSKQLYLASGNSHKAEEFKTLFDQAVINIMPAGKAIEVDETGTSFNENAFIKAEAYYNLLKKPVVSDDSGIVVPSLPEDLGIYSARFGGPGLNDRERALLLLEKMKKFTEREAREAHFVCVLCFYFSPEEFYFFEGRMHGFVGEEYSGEYGFGYDPIFHAYGEHEDKAVASVPAWKSLNSHRSLACAHANSFFNSLE